MNAYNISLPKPTEKPKRQEVGLPTLTETLDLASRYP
jgi:hypothetical protein